MRKQYQSERDPITNKLTFKNKIIKYEKGDLRVVPANVTGSDLRCCLLLGTATNPKFPLKHLWQYVLFLPGMKW